MNTFSHYGLLFLSNILTWLLWPTLMSTLKSLCSWYIYTIRHVCHCPRTQGKVNKSVRRPVAGVCLLLAAKFVLDLKRKEISDLIEVSLPLLRVKSYFTSRLSLYAGDCRQFQAVFSRAAPVRIPSVGRPPVFSPHSQSPGQIPP